MQIARSSLWQYNPLRNKTYHRIMNAIIVMVQDTNELYSAQYDDGACIQIDNGTLSKKRKNQSLTFRDLLINTLIMASCINAF